MVSRKALKATDSFRVIKLLFIKLGLVLSFCLSGCATDSSEYDYEVSAYQLGEKPVHVVYQPKTSNYYTRISKGYAESGITKLTLSLDELGRVNGAELDKGSGFTRLDTSAIDLASSMVFEPAALGENKQRTLKLYVNFHKEKVVPPVKVTNVTYRVELLTGFQYRVVIGAVANPEGFMESVYPIDGISNASINLEALGYGSRYLAEPYPVEQRVEKQDLRLQITFN